MNKIFQINSDTNQLTIDGIAIPRNARIYRQGETLFVEDQEYDLNPLGCHISRSLMYIKSNTPYSIQYLIELAMQQNHSAEVPVYLQVRHDVGTQPEVGLPPMYVGANGERIATMNKIRNFIVGTGIATALFVGAVLLWPHADNTIQGDGKDITTIVEESVHSDYINIGTK